MESNIDRTSEIDALAELLPQRRAGIMELANMTPFQRVHLVKRIVFNASGLITGLLALDEKNLPDQEYWDKHNDFFQTAIQEVERRNQSD